MGKELNIWKKKFRNSKEWKEKRDKLIIKRGGKCEWCDSTEFLTPAHQDCHRIYDINGTGFKINFLIINSVLKTNYYTIFKCYLKQNLINSLPEKDFETFSVCKNCNSKSYLIKERKTIKPRFRCGGCGSTFDDLDSNLKEIKKDNGKLKKDVWKRLYEDEEIKKVLLPIEEGMKKLFIEWYQNFDNCLLLCRRCHLAQSKGLLLCKCRKRYYFQQNGSCPDCYPKEKKEEIAKRKKEREKEEEEYRKFEEEMDKQEAEFEAESQEYFESLKEKGEKK